MYILDDIDRLILAHLAAVGIPQTTGQIHHALQDHTPAPSYDQIRWRLRGLPPTGLVTSQAIPSLGARIVYAYSLPFITPEMSERECIAAIRERVARFRATA